jgi:hypothetical protein
MLMMPASFLHDLEIEDETVLGMIPIYRFLPDVIYIGWYFG